MHAFILASNPEEAVGIQSVNQNSRTSMNMPSQVLCIKQNKNPVLFRI